jgi:molybdate/tungstate transport system substrate-binding protein
MGRRTVLAVALLLLVLGLVQVVLVVGRTDSALAPRKLIVFHAGSLSVPFREVSELFEERHPGVVVEAEAAGSRHCAQKIRDLGRECDVFGSADYKVVENLLVPEFADFNICFATNRMGIAYTSASAAASEIGTDNWHEVLRRPEVAFGRANPDSDPCGYRTLMVFQLAGKHYGLPRLAAELQEKDGTKFIRPKETDLLALLEAGEIDYLFIYRSVAQQHGLDFVELPDEVNLGSAALAEVYGAAQVNVTGKEPGEFITRVGAPIVYSVTIPKNAPNRALAEDYLALLLSADGRAIMDRNGQRPIVPPRPTPAGPVPPRLEPLLAP